MEWLEEGSASQVDTESDMVMAESGFEPVGLDLQA